MKLKNLCFSLAALSGFFISQNVWAVTSNYTTYASGQTLTAASLNSLQTNYTDGDNNILNGDTFTGSMSYHSGADAIGYSDTGSTKKWELDSATGDVIMSPRTLGTAINCEINYSSGTITISGRGGVALAATNPCHVGIRSNSNGVVATATFTANVTTTDGAASDSDGNLFGITDANWASAMPIFFGVIYDGTTPYFGFSRVPLQVSGAAATDLCQEGDTDCDAQTDFFIMTTGLTLASWVNLPITQVAWLSATYATTGGAWTFAETAYTGFNELYEARRFTMPTGQNGASTGTHVLANGGTAPIFTTNNYVYQIENTGNVWLEFYLDADGGEDGAGAVASRLSIPYAVPAAGSVTSIDYLPLGMTTGQTTITNQGLLRGQVVPGSAYLVLIYDDNAVTATAVTNAMYSNGARRISGRSAINVLIN